MFFKKCITEDVRKVTEVSQTVLPNFGGSAYSKLKSQVYTSNRIMPKVPKHLKVKDSVEILCCLTKGESPLVQTKKDKNDYENQDISISECCESNNFYKIRIS